MPSKPSFQGQRHLLMLYLYLFMLTNKWRKGKRSGPDQTAYGPVRQGCVQCLWAPKLLRTLQCTWSTSSASVFGCFSNHRIQEWFGLEGILLIISFHSMPWAGTSSTEQSITKDNLEKSDLAYTWIRYRCKSLEGWQFHWCSWPRNANPGFLQIYGWKILFIYNYSLSSFLYWTEPCSQQTL